MVAPATPAAGVAVWIAPNVVPGDDLLAAIVAPALNRAVAQQLAGVITAGRDAEAGDRGEVADVRRRRDRTGPGGIAHLQLIIASPALNRPAGQQRAGVIAPRGEGDDASGERHRGRKIIV